ncbi:MAG: alpha/beta hydrolase domain-containing protein [Gammaproteobacteria bacterium]|jgi:hypothetical protein|nr:alpha/beta hydrolase domain-containing protein [Gammaproteobacteria bacterium]
MSKQRTSFLKTALTALTLIVSSQAFSQGGPLAGFMIEPIVPEQSTIASIPSIRPIIGSGNAWDSSPAQWPGYGIEEFDYEVNEYYISGMAAGEPYTTRLVIRRPANDNDSSGLVVAEAMHPIGGAHAFEYNSVYIMDSGHIALEVSTLGAAQINEYNPRRYGDIQISPAQTSEVLAQAGALIKSAQSPIAELNPRKMILWGTSASSMIMTRYLSAHAVFTLADGSNIYDGFMPTSNGSDIEPVDVPMIQVPTQHEYEVGATSIQDGDEPGNQFRVYEFAGLAHLDARNNSARFTQNDCQHPMSMFPQEAYFSVALHHLLEWVDNGTVPPRAPRILMDNYVENDDSLMLLDSNGNPYGGIRNPYVDLAAYKYTMVNIYIGDANVQGMGANVLCRISGWQTSVEQADLRREYRNTTNYVSQFEDRLSELEAAGWSLPVYHDLIMQDAQNVDF